MTSKSYQLVGTKSKSYQPWKTSQRVSNHLLIRWCSESSDYMLSNRISIVWNYQCRDCRLPVCTGVTSKVQLSRLPPFQKQNKKKGAYCAKNEFECLLFMSSINLPVRSRLYRESLNRRWSLSFLNSNAQLTTRCDGHTIKAFFMVGWTSAETQI